jgi:ATP synthase protein I
VTELSQVRGVAYRVVRGQAVLTAVIALACWAWMGRNAGVSAAVGGAIGTAATLTLALIAFRDGDQDVHRLLRTFYLGEAAKVGVMVLLFVVALTTLKRVLVPAAMFGAYVATFLVHWVGLKRTLLTLGGHKVS